MLIENYISQALEQAVIVTLSYEKDS